MKEMQTQLNRIEGMLNQLLAMQPKPIHNATEDEIFDAGIAQGKSLDEITAEINAFKERRDEANT